MCKLSMPIQISKLHLKVKRRAPGFPGQRDYSAIPQEDYKSTIQLLQDQKEKATEEPWLREMVRCGIQLLYLKL